MGQKYLQLSGKLTQFIQDQQLFFVGTADVDGRVNVSPKGLDTLRVINEKQVVWLNLTGSGNETSAHVQNFPRMTLMFSAFQGKPMILRLYGTAKVIHKKDKQWNELNQLFDGYISARQIFLLDIDMVQTSCGMAVPFYDYKDQRGQLLNSATLKGQEKIEKYWVERNHLSIDGKKTNIVEKNL